MRLVRVMSLLAALLLAGNEITAAADWPSVLLYQKDGAAAGNRLGGSVAGAGDVNGDGYADFIIGAYNADPGGRSGAGSAYVYSGLNGGLLYQKDGVAAADALGISVAGAGDVNGDGKDDFIIGAYTASPGGRIFAGSAYVYSGLNGGLLYQKDGAAANDRLGRSVAGAEDVNGDGKDDFIIGAYAADPGGRTDAGSAYVYSGLNGGLLYQKDGAAAGDNLGISVAGAGDVNGDGKDDFIIGAYAADPGGRADAGSAFVYSGLDGGLLYQKDGAAAADALGISVAGAGDVNGDGKADFIIGAYTADPGGRVSAGSAFVYSGLNGTLLYQKDGAAAGDALGNSVAGAGDVTGDGKADFIIGAYLARPGGQSGAGSAYVYSGLNGGLLYQRDGAAAADALGISVAGAGDVNGDRKADLIIGASGAAPGGRLSAGSAYVIASGYLERITRLIDVPNDQGRQVVLEWNSQPGNDNFVKQFAIYRRADGTAAASKPSDPFAFLKTPPGTWHFVQSVPARGDTLYGAVAPTLFDSTVAGGMNYSVFFVSGIGDNPTDHFDSPVDSGYSLDNLSPAPPPMLIAALAGANVDLHWRSVADVDFDHYWVCRDTLPSFALSPLKRIGSTSDTALLDTSVPSASAVYYKVTAVDFSGNEGNPSNEASVGSCSCPCANDPQCDGVISDVLDVTNTVGVAFRGATPVFDPNCPYERSDVDCGGFTDVLDVTKIVGVAFRGGNPATEYCKPCFGVL